MAELRASVVIPTYNRRAFLLQTLESLERQTASGDAFEVVVGVDGSTDGTVQALERLDPPYLLRWVDQRNGGPAAATNAAARIARHEVLIFLDDDQLAAPGLVEAHLRAHQRLGDVLVQGFYPLAPGYDRRGASLLYQRSFISTFAPIDRAHPTTAHVWSANMSLRRATWAAVGGLDETFREYGGEDTDFGVRLARDRGVPVLFEPAALSYHLHSVSYRATRRQAFSAGRSLVRALGVPDLPPRTSAFDPGYDPGTVRSHLEQSGRLLSRLKLSMATWLIADEAATRSKIEAAHRLQVPLVTGGGPYEIAQARGCLDAFVELCASLRIERIEVGEGFTEPRSPEGIM